jgi:D-glycero-D-manno-heptose 1,7-bisphosphate phosphatase
VNAAVFLDRDGVLNDLVPDPDSGVPESPLQIGQVRLMPGAVAAAESLARAGYVLVCVSNQPAAAKGKVSVSQLLAVHEQVITLLRREGLTLAAWRLCLHHIDGVVPELCGPCACRKPEPGMLLDLAAALNIDLARSWMVGDTDADMQAGKAVGCRTMLIRHPGSIHKRLQVLQADLVVDSLADGVRTLRPRQSETFTKS